MSKEPQKKHEEHISEHEVEAIEAHAPITAPAIFEAIRRQGETELMRPVSALSMSALIAGMALGFSVLAEGVLRAHIPDAQWRPLIESFGYSVGFMLVILGQMQLFTENTITAVCPVLDEPSRAAFGRLMRLWSLVLLFNVIGATGFGFVLWAMQDIQPETWEAVEALSIEAVTGGWWPTLLKGIGAGWLIAALVWVMPNAENTKVGLIVLITYLIALAEFAHVVAGTAEASALMFEGILTPVEAYWGFVTPAMIGDSLGAPCSSPSLPGRRSGPNSSRARKEDRARQGCHHVSNKWRERALMWQPHINQGETHV